MERTRMSSKGQVVIPQAIRRAQGLQPGAEFDVEVTAAGLLFKPVPVFPLTRWEDVRGCLRYQGPSITLEEMENAIAEGALRQA